VAPSGERRVSVRGHSCRITPGVGGTSTVTALEAASAGLPLAFQLLVYPVTDASRESVSKRLFGSGFYLTEEFLDQCRDHYLPDRRGAWTRA
jgi:acetyl esterase/lipase